MGKLELSNVLFLASDGIHKTNVHWIVLVVVLVSAGASIFSSCGEWHTWVTFNKHGFSDNPLIPPKVPWMDGWLGLTILDTVAALSELVVGIVLFGATWYCHKKEKGDKYLDVWKITNKAVGLVALLHSLSLLILACFYYIVQSNCLDLCHIDKVYMCIGVIMGGQVIKLAVFIGDLLWHIKSMCPCRKEDNVRYSNTWFTHTSKILKTMNAIKAIFACILIVFGAVLLVLFGLLNDKDRGTIHVMQSNPQVALFNIAELLPGEELTQVFPIETNSTYCLATFRYDEDSYQFTFNVAYVTIKTTNGSTGQCVCIPNHEHCEVLHDQLYYGHSSNGEPYACLNTHARLVGIDKENSPTFDKDSEVNCSCVGLLN